MHKAMRVPARGEHWSKSRSIEEQVFSALRDKDEDVPPSHMVIDTTYLIYEFAKAFGTTVPWVATTEAIVGFPGLTCVWGTIDGRATETCTLSGDYDEAMLKRILETIVHTGATIEHQHHLTVILHW